MVSVADIMQEQYDQKTGKQNKENLRRTVNVLAVATTLSTEICTMLSST